MLPDWQQLRKLLRSYDDRLFVLTSMIRVSSQSLRTKPVVSSPKDPKLSSFYSQSQGSGLTGVNNAKEPKLTSVYSQRGNL